MELINYIKPELMVLVPVLYLIGMGLKRSKVRDKKIPLILGAAGVMLSAIWTLATSDVETLKQIAVALFTAITQGVLTAGASVYINQLYVQFKKKE